MHHPGRRDRYLHAILVILYALLAGPAAATEDALENWLAEPVGGVPAVTETRVWTWTAWSAGLPESRSGQRRQARRLRLDVSPFVGEVVEWFRRAGIPLREERHPDHDRTVGISATMHLADDLPALSVWISQRSREPLGAFYAPRGGMSWAIVWPVDRFTLRLEGGDDSEFGNFAILGAHWRHPKRPLAVGLGMPVQMKDTDGDVGVLLQVRMQFD